MRKSLIMSEIKEKETFTSLGMSKVGIQFKSGQVFNAYTSSIDIKGWKFLITVRGQQLAWRLSDVVGIWKCDKYAVTIGEKLVKGDSGEYRHNYEMKQE